MNGKVTVVICINRRLSEASPSCAERGSELMADVLEQCLEASGLPGAVHRVECLGQCERGPSLRIAPGGRFFHKLTIEQLPEVISELQRHTSAQ